MLVEVATKKGEAENMAAPLPSYDITIVVHAPDQPEHRIEVAHHGVRREEAMQQPALASAIALFEASEPIGTAKPVDERIQREHPVLVPATGTRRFPRWRVNHPVMVIAATAPEPIAGEALVIGEGGMAVRLPTQLQEGERVTVSIFDAESDRAVQLGAAVRNRHGDQYGLEFLGLSNTEKAQLRNALCLESPA